MEANFNSLHDWATKFVEDNLSPNEKIELQQYLAENPQLHQTWLEEIQLIELLKKQAPHALFRQKVHTQQQIFNQETIENTSSPFLKVIKRLNFKRSVVVGAAASLVIVLTSIFTVYKITQHDYQNSSNQYTLLKKEIKNIKDSHRQLLDSINKRQVAQGLATLPDNPALYGGTGFALTNDGFIATNYHVVEKAEKIYVQTDKGDNYLAYVVAFDPNNDFAILKIQHPDFSFGKNPLPYKVLTNNAHLGQQVFSLGYPKESLVYNNGYISSESGYESSPNAYQLEISANSGQSGAPVFDAKGQIIGMITGKQKDSYGVTFATHTKELLSLVQSLPKGTNLKLRNTSGNLQNLSQAEKVKVLRKYIVSVKVY